MSAPFKATAQQVRDLADFVGDLSRATNRNGVRVCVYGPIDVAVSGNTIAIAWDDDLDEYVVSDQVGN